MQWEQLPKKCLQEYRKKNRFKSEWVLKEYELNSGMSEQYEDSIFQKFGHINRKSINHKTNIRKNKWIELDGED